MRQVPGRQTLDAAETEEVPPSLSRKESERSSERQNIKSQSLGSGKVVPIA